MAKTLSETPVEVEEYETEEYEDDEEEIDEEPNKVHYSFIQKELLAKREILLFGDIEAATAYETVAAIHYMNSISDELITIYINSPGGEIEGFFAMYDAFNLSKSPISTVCIGEACSCAAILLACGTPGHRYITENSISMVHELQLEEISCTATTFEDEVRSIKNLNQKIIKILAKHTGHPYKAVQKDCKSDTYMNAKEAKMYGLVDHVLKPTNKPPKLTKSKSEKPAAQFKNKRFPHI